MDGHIIIKLEGSLEIEHLFHSIKMEALEKHKHLSKFLLQSEVKPGKSCLLLLIIPVFWDNLPDNFTWSVHFMSEYSTNTTMKFPS